MSPHRLRVLITGLTLRLFDAGGSLPREIEPPPGREVTAAAWALDGAHFVYVIGPKGFQSL